MGTLRALFETWFSLSLKFKIFGRVTSGNKELSRFSYRNIFTALIPHYYIPPTSQSNFLLGLYFLYLFLGTSVSFILITVSSFQNLFTRNIHIIPHLSDILQFNSSKDLSHSHIFSSPLLHRYHKSFDCFYYFFFYCSYFSALWQFLIQRTTYVQIFQVFLYLSIGKKL